VNWSPGHLLVVCLFLVSPAGAFAQEPSNLRIDGVFSDWRSSFGAHADGEFLYLRFTLPEKVTLQGAPVPVRLFLDLDDNPDTRHAGLVQTLGLGADLVVTFSPARPGGGRGGGVGIEGKGEGVSVGGQSPTPGRLGLIFAPTTESSSFELRLKRPDGPTHPAPESLSLRLSVAPSDPGEQSARADRGSDRPRGAERQSDVAWQSEILRVLLPPRSAEPRLAPALVAHQPTHLRVVSWNVLFARPMSNPAPFARIFRALDPDVVLLQEWEKVDDLSLAAWFDTHVPKSTPWHARTSAGWGVALVSRTPLERLGMAAVDRPEGAPADDFRPDQSLRVVAARTQTRLGRVVMASIHLRCCGYAGSWQDRARIAETTAIQEMLQSVFGAEKSIRVVGGDLNLVGSRQPLEILSRGLGRGGEDLQPAQAPLLGDVAYHTWRDPRSRFTPGRLDWILYDPTAARETTSFVFDTRGLQPEALARSGLEIGDSDASDHLALVLDLAVGAP
jgi:endonuclease/exonuclease/phosphatase family metal-dependent hydrolase